MKITFILTAVHNVMGEFIYKNNYDINHIVLSGRMGVQAKYSKKHVLNYQDGVFGMLFASQKELLVFTRPIIMQCLDYVRFLPWGIWMGMKRAKKQAFSLVLISALDQT